MRDIPPDILTAAYATAAELGIRGALRNVVALAIAQSVLAERERAAGHVSAAAASVRKAGDGSVEHVTRSVIQIIDAAATAIRGGVQ